MTTVIAVSFILGAAAVLALPHRARLLERSFWQRQASPGELSAAHASLEARCSACHTPLEGAAAANCIVCHASETRLLERQTTAFHSSIGACAECHGEHRGRRPPPTAMDHAVLAKIGLRMLARGEPGSEARELSDRLRHAMAGGGELRPASSLTASERVLDCAACHANQDRHRALFGRDCSQCHETEKWTIAAFRHPPPSSMDCAQCHQAPPSHYMEHFAMVSMRVAGKEHADVEQCFLCHQTTAWNDIQGVGFYKHH